MSLNAGEMSPADIAAITGNRDDGFMGGNSAWWIIILFLFAFCGGWGGNGFGANGNGSGVADGYVLTSDFANLERKIDAVNSGLCDGFYSEAQLANGINTNILQQGNATNVAMLQGFNELGGKLADCCCQNRYDALKTASETQRIIENGFSGATYQRASDTCAIKTEIANGTRDIIEAGHADTRAILEKLTAQEIAAKDARIDELTRKLGAAELSASQAAQNNVLIGALRPSPIPAYTVQNPYQSYGCFGGCGSC